MLGDLGGEGVLSLRVGEGSESDLGSWGCGFLGEVVCWDVSGRFNRWSFGLGFDVRE